MITFISYMPGARGKFVTEICELSHSSANNSNKTSAGGNISWVSMLTDDLQKLGISWQEIHYLDPENEKFKFYVDSIISAGSQLGIENLFIDTHYILPETFEYAISRGCRVIRIVVNNDENLDNLQNNFFYKNFIEKYDDPNARASCQNLAKKNIIQRKNSRSKWPITEEEFKNVENMFDIPLAHWTKEQLKILHRCSKFGDLQDKNIMNHSSLIEVNYDDLLKEDTIKKIVEFVAGQYNDNVKRRFDDYVVGQNKVVDFDSYIDKFIRDYQNV